MGFVDPGPLQSWTAADFGWLDDHAAEFLLTSDEPPPHAPTTAARMAEIGPTLTTLLGQLEALPALKLYAYHVFSIACARHQLANGPHPTSGITRWLQREDDIPSVSDQ